LETVVDNRSLLLFNGAMDANDIGPSKAHWLAKRLEEDILTRGLRVGEPYLTTAQAGRQLGISKAMAYRAMKILVARNVLVSHPGRGTFVGPEAAAAPSAQTKCIRILSMYDLLLGSEQATYGLVTGLVKTLPGYSIQFDFLQSHDAEKQAGHFLAQGMKSGSLSAVIMKGCPQAVQEQVLHFGVPAVVFGTDYSSTRQLPSVDADQFEIGRLAAEYLLKRGHRRIALLMREMWFPGDRKMYEGVGRALDDAGLGHDSLMLRNLSVEVEVLSADLRRLFAAKDRPTGCVCRSPFFAETVVRVAEDAGLSVPDDLEVISDGRSRQTAALLSLPSVCMKVSMEEQVAIGGRMLAQLFEGRQPDPIHVILPVELIEPSPRKSHAPKSGGRKHRTPAKKTK
jgi:DNA-binding LacI/PurR family transcriptional regulator